MNEFKPPEPLIFSGNLSENWRRWAQRFELYLTASGKVKENEKTQVAILLHLLGEEGIEIYNNFTWAPETDGVPAEDPNKLETVKKKFKDYCNPRKNTVMERYTFWETKQEEIVADNMPFNSKYFREFGKKYNIRITTSSPTHSQSNGMAERSIQTIKNLFRKAHAEGKDEHIALLEYRNTPLTDCDYSPAQLLMNRMLRDRIPTKPDFLEPKIPEKAREQLLKRQKTQKSQYDKNAKDMKQLNAGDSVRYRVGKTWEPAVIIDKHESPRSYVIANEYGNQLRRNRVHLQKTNEKPIPIMEPEYDEYDTSSPEIPQVPEQPRKQPETTNTNRTPPRSSLGTPRILRPRRDIQKPARYRDQSFRY